MQMICFMWMMICVSCATFILCPKYNFFVIVFLSFLFFGITIDYINNFTREFYNNTK
jgi:hypothetical protein